MPNIRDEERTSLKTQGLVKRLPEFVRNAPILLYLVGFADFAKNILPLIQYEMVGFADGVPIGGASRFLVLKLLLSALIYAANYIAWGVFAYLLIAIHDGLRERSAPSERVD